MKNRPIGGFALYTAGRYLFDGNFGALDCFAHKATVWLYVDTSEASTVQIPQYAQPSSR